MLSSFLTQSLGEGGGWAGGLERGRLKRGEGREGQAIPEKKGERGKKIRREMKGRVETQRKKLSDHLISLK